MRIIRIYVLLLSMTLIGSFLGANSACAGESGSVAQAKFLEAAFHEGVPEHKTLWIDKALKKDVKKILRHDYPALRVRYWQDGARTVWVLEEIGKYKPITVGVVINEGAIEKLDVLAYRESHGWEVKHDFFTRQFIGARLPKNKN